MPADGFTNLPRFSLPLDWCPRFTKARAIVVALLILLDERRRFDGRFHASDTLPILEREASQLREAKSNC